MQGDIHFSKAFKIEMTTCLNYKMLKMHVIHVVLYRSHNHRIFIKFKPVQHDMFSYVYISHCCKL